MLQIKFFKYTKKNYIACQIICIMLATVFVPWTIYVLLHPNITKTGVTFNFAPNSMATIFSEKNITGRFQEKLSSFSKQAADYYVSTPIQNNLNVIGADVYGKKPVRVPVLGPVVKNGAKPLYGMEHNPQLQK